MLEYPHIETTIPIDRRILIKMKIREGQIVITSPNKEAYEELKETLKDVIKSMDKVLKEYL